MRRQDVADDGSGDVTADKNDQLDETWCLYDCMLVDDELCAMSSRFSVSVRIFVLSDICYSGTVTKMEHYRALLTVPASLAFEAQDPFTL